MDLSDNSQLEDQYFVYKHDQLFGESFPLFKEIRRMGKLCDVTLKVGGPSQNGAINYPQLRDTNII